MLLFLKFELLLSLHFFEFQLALSLLFFEFHLAFSPFHLEFQLEFFPFHLEFHLVFGPLHGHDLLWRGFDQALHVLPWAAVLIRQRDDPVLVHKLRVNTQTKRNVQLRTCETDTLETGSVSERIV